MERRIVSRVGVLAAALCVSLALLACLPWPAAADGIIIPRPPPDRVIPWRDIPLAVKYHRVDVQIKDQVATTHVDQVFVNHAGFAVEGTYIFPLPEDAAISSFDMWVDGQKLEGKLLGREEARAIYEDIVRRQRDPALLEYVGRGAFQASIFPIPPGAERRIELTYAQVLPLSEGLVHYRYPLNTEKFSARPLAEVAVTVHVEDKSALRAIYSPSHVVDVARESERTATVSYEAHNTRPDRDFDLYYGVSSGAVAANVLTYKSFDEDGFFLLLVSPPFKVLGDMAVEKDVILVLDVSGSMDGAKLEQAKKAADYVLDHLGEGDRFNIVAFSSATRLFAEAPVSLDRRAEAHSFIKRLTAVGSTDINRGLLEALAGADDDRPTVLIFATDGLPTLGEVNPDRIVANVTHSAPKSVRLFAFGIGYDVDTVLLDQLSSQLRGTSAYVKPNEGIDEVVSGFYAKVSTPVLVDVGLSFSGVQVEDIYPYPLPDLFAGTQLAVVGRYRQGGTAVLKLTGSINGRPQSYTYGNLAFVKRGGNEFIPRVWAQRKIGQLLAEIRLKGAQDELVKEIVALSTRYGIVTPYTSFLVEEPQMALTEGGRDALAHDLQTPAPFAVQGAGAPTQAPALAGAPRAGEQAVERAQAEKTLSDSSQAAAPATGAAADVIRQVGDKAFLLHDGVWTDTTFDETKMKADAIAFGSDRYFELLTQHPEIGPFLALGDRVTVLIEGRAYAVGPEGATTAAATPARTPTSAPRATATTRPASPTSVPASRTPAPNTTARATEPQRAATVAAATATPQVIAEAVPTEPAKAPAGGGSPICVTPAFVGLIGLLPAWALRRTRSSRG